MFYEHGEQSVYHCRHQFRIGVSSYLLDSFGHTRQKGNTSPLSDPFPVHQVQYVLPPRVSAVCFHPVIFQVFGIRSIRMSPADPVRRYTTILVHLNAFLYIPVRCGNGCTHSVCLYQLQPQIIQQPRSLCHWHQHQYIPRQKPVQKCKLLNRIEIVYPAGITHGRFRPDCKLSLNLPSQFLCFFICDSKYRCIRCGFQPQPRPNHVCSGCVYRTGCQRNCHIQFP